VEEYLHLDRASAEIRYEYIDGRVMMLADGTLNHATIAANIIITLGNLLRGSPCRIFTSDARVRLSEQRYVYPDATVSCDMQDRGTADIVQFPRLVVEVLSPSTEAYDRGRKLAYYRGCPSIQEYMLVDTQLQSIELFCRQKEALWSYLVFNIGDTVELASIDVQFPLAAIYEDVAFPQEDDDLP